MSDTVWANACLSDGEILFWYTGSKCETVYDFYKDFYYAKIKLSEYEKAHKLELAQMEIDNSDNWKAFNVLAPNFYKQFKISPDSKGSKPY